MTQVQELATFVERVQLDDLSEQALEQLKIRVLDTIGVAIGALTAGPISAIGALTAELGGRPLATLIGGFKTVAAIHPGIFRLRCHVWICVGHHFLVVGGAVRELP